MDEWDARFDLDALKVPFRPRHIKKLGFYAEEGDSRLRRLKFDAAPETLCLWNFLLSENTRLAEDRARGFKLIGTMKDLGTVPVMAYAFRNLRAFYPDGAWWLPCIMESNSAALAVADSLGLNETLCPVRAMAGALAAQTDFPEPDLLICAAGATCDDFSAIAQFVNGMGHPIHWWELPYRRPPSEGEAAIMLPTGQTAPAELADIVRDELAMIKSLLESCAGYKLEDTTLSEAIRRANHSRNILRKIRKEVFMAPGIILSALELLITEMLIIHSCSDPDECNRVLESIFSLVSERKSRCEATEHCRVFWVNPPADIKAMNILEESGFRLCGTDFMFAHAIAPVPILPDPLSGLALSVLSDPMTGPSGQRAALIASECRKYNAEGVIVSRIPGASHCAYEGSVIKEEIGRELDIPVIEVEIPAVCDAYTAPLRNRLEALAETIIMRREKDK